MSTPLGTAGTDFAAVFGQQPTAYLLMSPDLVIVEANDAYLQLLGRVREDLVGRPVFEAFPPAPEALDANGANPLQLSFERARDTGRPDPMPLFHYDVLDQDSGRLVHRVWSLISAPVLDADGQTQLVLQRVEDVSEYVAERERLAERAHGAGGQRLELLEADLFARAGELRTALAAQETATRRLAGMAQVALQLSAAETVSDLIETVAGAGLTALGADGGAVGVRDDVQGVVRVTITGGLGAEAQHRFGELPLDSRIPAAWSATTGQRLLLADRAAGLAWAPEMAEVYESTGRHAWVSVPLRVGERLLGSLVAGWVEERPFEAAELELLEAFAAQCAQALQRLQVLTEERRTAEASRLLSETLQRSLLTEPAPAAHLDIAVRYRPASAGAEIGGDWYDVFELTDGALTMVVGDVSGHDRNAAAVMAEIRNVLRGVAQMVQAPPGRVLTALDTALENLRVGSLATAVLLQVRQDEGQTASGVCDVRWSNAGHPPPLLLLADGTTELLSRRADLLLGVLQGSPRTDHQVQLEAGATLLLYTDGLIERRGADLDAGTERLRRTAAALARESVDDLCDGILHRLGSQPDDDIVLVALRVRPV